MRGNNSIAPPRDTLWIHCIACAGGGMPAARRPERPGGPPAPGAGWQPGTDPGPARPRRGAARGGKRWGAPRLAEATLQRRAALSRLASADDVEASSRTRMTSIVSSAWSSEVASAEGPCGSKWDEHLKRVLCGVNFELTPQV